MADGEAPDAFDSFVFKDLANAYVQQPSMTLAEINALLESFERHKQRLIVPTARVDEFEAAVRDANLGHVVTVVGHPWLEPDQVFLMQSEAEFDADMRASIEAGRNEMLTAMREQAAAYMEQLRAEMEEEARREHEREMWPLLHPWPRPPFAGLLGI